MKQDVKSQYYAAREERSIAECECPHWDYENESCGLWACCERLQLADERVRTLAKRLKEQNRATLI